MSLRLSMLLVAAVLLSSCATSNRGWSGDNATPFDTAQADCDAKSGALPAGKEREAAFDHCMAEHGWRRP